MKKVIAGLTPSDSPKHRKTPLKNRATHYSKASLNCRHYLTGLTWLVILTAGAFAAQQKESLTPSLGVQDSNLTAEEQLLLTTHSISGCTLYDYVKELASDKYAGRLTGTKEYDACAEWVADKFKQFGLRGGAVEEPYFQMFPISYTLVLPGCELYLHTQQNGKKYYKYPDEFMPGSTSGQGEVTAEVIYVGYGITAKDLKYDDYAGINARGKIVLVEREVPVSDEADPNTFVKWRPYSFHDYKLGNAFKHGAIGMLYNYGPIANPNNIYVKGFVYSHVGTTVVEDIFAGSGRNYAQTLKEIKTTLQPHSFATGKTVTIKNVTQNTALAWGRNVIGILDGNDPNLKNEFFVISAHLDHVGKCYTLIPGANDNASGVAALLGTAEALSKSPVKPRRSVMFICFGAEEQGVAGSLYFIFRPPFP